MKISIIQLKILKRSFSVKMSRIEIVSEPKLQHILWNYLEEKGYEVGAEVSVTHTSRKIDLVAKKEDKFIGYEIKDNFNAVRRSTNQFASYKNGGFLDEIFLVIPKDEYEDVRRSYEWLFDDIGIITIDKKYDVAMEKPSPSLQRKYTPKFKENEAWLRHRIWNCLERKGYIVEGEGYILKPEEELGVVMDRWHPLPKDFLLKVDLCILPEERDFPVGIEVKHRLDRRTDFQLKEYTLSRCLKQFYLATPLGKLSVAKKIDGVGKWFGIITYNKFLDDIKINVEAPDLLKRDPGADRDGFVYLSARKNTIWKGGLSSSSSIYWRLYPSLP